MSHPAPENADSRSATSDESEDDRQGQGSGHDSLTSSPPVVSGSPIPGGVLVGGHPESDRYPGAGGRVDTDQDAGSQASSSKADAAREQGQQVKDQAVQGGKKVAGVAAEQGQSVAAEATDQAKDVMGQAKSQLMEQAATQQENLTDWLRSLADELHQMVDRGSEQGEGDRSSASSDNQSRGAASNGVATKAASQAQGRVAEAADWLEKHEPGDLVDEATRFARRRPGAFLAVAAVGGLLVGRFTRGLKDDSSAGAGPSRGPAGRADSRGVPPAQGVDLSSAERAAGQPELGSR